MAERSTITQVVQLGLETTSGTSVAAGKLMQALMIEADLSMNFDSFRPSGFKYPTIVALGKDATGGKISGAPTYTEMVYLFSSIFGAATITTPGGGTASRLWTFAPSTTAEDIPKTYTIEMGSAARAHKFSYATVVGLTLGGDREKLTLSGDMIGQLLTDGITLTTTPTAIALQPILPKEVSIFSDTTSGGLGGTKLLRAFNWELSITNKYSPVWVVDAANTSWVTHVETEPQARFKMTLEADANGMAFLADARLGTTKFIRVLAQTSTFIETTIPWKMGLDLVCKVINVGTFKDEGGVYAVDFEFAVVHDAGFGKALVPTLQNQLVAL